MRLALVLSATFAFQVVAWFHAASLRMHDGSRKETGVTVSGNIDPFIDSEVMAFKFLLHGGIWMTRIVHIEAETYAFTPYGRILEMEQGEFPYWFVIDSHWYFGDWRNYTFPRSKKKRLEDYYK